MVDELVRVGDRDAILRAVGHAPLVIVGAFLGAILVSGFGTAVLVPGGGGLETVTPVVYAALNALQFVGFLLVGYFYVEHVADRSLVHLRRPTLRDVAWVVLGLVALFVATLFLGVLFRTLGIEEPAANRAVETSREQPLRLLYMAAVSILFVAPGEELLFRGAVQGLFRRALGVAPAIAIASAGFGVVHYVALVGANSGDPTLAGIAVYLTIAAVLGVILGTLYEYTETLLVPVAIHGLWNAYQFLLVYALETGAIDVPAVAL